MLIKLKTFDSINDGYLSVINESVSNIGSFKRIYYIYGVSKNVTRGHHAHLNLKQIAWCPHGSVEILLDNGVTKNKFSLDSPEKGLYIGPGIWREMKWLITDSVLCVAASELYDENDYVRDYDKFLQMVNEGYWSGN